MFDDLMKMATGAAGTAQAGAQEMSGQMKDWMLNTGQEVGFATREELDVLRARIDELEKKLAEHDHNNA